MDANKSYVRSNSICTINDAPVLVINVTDTFKYLGVDFLYKGVTACQLDPLN